MTDRDADTTGTQPDDDAYVAALTAEGDVARLARERDEALTERDEARAAAARYREALERIVAQLDPLYRIASDATAATDLAREALGE